MVAVQDDPDRRRGRSTSESACERLQVLNCGARERDWWEEYADLPPMRGLRGWSFFNGQFLPGFMPGLLQTAEYAGRGEGLALAVRSCRTVEHLA
jgi:hypothetical protein